MYFDRNVHGVKETESFHFPSDNFIISDMTFCEKSKIDLLFLPDFLGFILRKAIKHNASKKIDDRIATNAHKNYLKILNSKNFHVVNIQEEIVDQVINQL